MDIAKTKFPLCQDWVCYFRSHGVILLLACAYERPSLVWLGFVNRNLKLECDVMCCTHTVRKVIDFRATVTVAVAVGTLFHSIPRSDGFRLEEVRLGGFRFGYLTPYLLSLAYAHIFLRFDHEDVSSSHVLCGGDRFSLRSER